MEMESIINLSSSSLLTSKNTASHHAMDLPADILESVLTLLPAVDLLSAGYVSHEWLHAVRSSLRTRPRLFPWLLIRCLPLPTTTASGYSLHAFDPYSRTWLSLPPSNTNSAPPTFSGNLLYALSPTQLLLFQDPFANSPPLQLKGPTVWRQDPIVAELGRWVVVVGGGFMAQFDDMEDEGAVEVYDKQTGMWGLAEPMPAKFEESPYAPWFSIAVSDKRLYIIEKKTGWASQFDPESKKWGPTCQLRPEQWVSKCAIGIIGKERLLLAGVGSKDAATMTVKFWEVEGDSLKVIGNMSEEMPAELVNCLYPNFVSLDDARRGACSLEVRGTELGGYMFDPGNMKNGMVMYELSTEVEGTGSRVERWEWIPCPATVGRGFMERMSVGSSPVALHQLPSTFNSNKQRAD